MSTGTAAYVAIQNEFKATQFADNFTTTFEPLLERIEKAVETSQAEADDLISMSQELAFVREGAKALKALDLGYNETVRNIRESRLLTDEGKAASIATEKQKRDAESERIRGLSIAQAAKLTERFTNKGFPPPSAELSAELQLVLAQSHVQGPITLIQNASDVLKRASDSSLPVAERARLNRLLADAYSPILERLSETVTENTGRLRPLAEKVSGAIDSHLSVVTGRSAQQAAREAAERIATDFRYIENNIETMPWDLIEQSSPLLFPKDSAE